MHKNFLKIINLFIIKFATVQKTFNLKLLIYMYMACCQILTSFWFQYFLNNCPICVYFFLTKIIQNYQIFPFSTTGIYGMGIVPKK